MEKIEDKWKEYSRTKNEKIREELVKNYLHIVKYQAEKIAGHLPSQVRSNDREDLYIEGIIGLLEAIDRFDPSKKVKFETFAVKRVRGAIIDTLRREDILPKNVREQAKKIERAYVEMEAALGRMPTDAEMAKEIGMTLDAFYDILEKLKGITLVSMDSEILNKKGEKFSFEDIIGEEGTALIDFEKEEARKTLASFIELLEKDERAVLELYYWDDLTLKEIGEVLGISESRVCQVHTAVMLKLRSRFRKMEKER